MACRIVNLHTQPLHIDLRGGDRLTLAPNERSRVLHEELLYDNQHLGEWERAGWLRRTPARMRELRAEQAAGAQAADREARKPVKAKAAVKKPASKKKQPSR